MRTVITSHLVNLAQLGPPNLNHREDLDIFGNRRSFWTHSQRMTDVQRMRALSAELRVKREVSRASWHTKMLHSHSASRYLCQFFPFDDQAGSDRLTSA